MVNANSDKIKPKFTIATFKVKYIRISKARAVISNLVWGLTRSLL